MSETVIVGQMCFIQTRVKAKECYRQLANVMCEEVETNERTLSTDPLNAYNLLPGESVPKWTIF